MRVNAPVSNPMPPVPRPGAQDSALRERRMSSQRDSVELPKDEPAPKMMAQDLVAFLKCL